MAEGLALLDEAMAAVAAGEVSPVFRQRLLLVIEGCQEIADLDRAAEWTTALSRWCDSQPGLVAFTGQCSVHRGQVMRLHGAWREALEEFDAAVERYRLATTDGRGRAAGERGDVLRLQGELAAAEAATSARASTASSRSPGSPCCGWPAGRDAAAVAAVRRLVAETADPVGQCRLLPAAVDVLLAAGDAATRPATSPRELEAIARALRLGRAAAPLAAYAVGRGRARRRRRRPARCPTCARRAGAGPRSTARTRSRGPGS